MKSGELQTGMRLPKTKSTALIAGAVFRHALPPRKAEEGSKKGTFLQRRCPAKELPDHRHRLVVVSRRDFNSVIVPTTLSSVVNFQSTRAAGRHAVTGVEVRGNGQLTIGVAAN